MRLRSATPLNPLVAGKARAILAARASSGRTVCRSFTPLVHDPATGAQREEYTNLLDARPGGPNYRIDRRTESNHPGYPVFGSLPPDLRPTPTLQL